MLVFHTDAFSMCLGSTIHYVCWLYYTDLYITSDTERIGMKRNNGKITVLTTFHLFLTESKRGLQEGWREIIHKGM